MNLHTKGELYNERMSPLKWNIDSYLFQEKKAKKKRKDTFIQQDQDAFFRVRYFKESVSFLACHIDAI